MLMIVLVVLVVVRYLHNITRVWDTRAMPRIKYSPRPPGRLYVTPRMYFTSSVYGRIGEIRDIVIEAFLIERNQHSFARYITVSEVKYEINAAKISF